ncbi:MAG: hypothetical protein ACTSW1_01370, partial [Candidatus Hodarchaeales archaeon]
YSRIKVHRIAEETRVMRCEPEEMWLDPTTYAIMQAGRTRALKLWTDKDQAEADLEARKFTMLQRLKSDKGIRIDVRPGEARRCENFCPVSEFCPQFEIFKQQQSEILNL